MIVLDASAAAGLLLEQDAFPAIVREMEGHDLAAPELMSVELLSVLRGWVRGGRLPERRARAALVDLELLGVHWYSELPLVPLAWSYRDNASAYDATYLALAEALGAEGRSVRVLTLDARLARSFPDLTVLPS